MRTKDGEQNLGDFEGLFGQRFRRRHQFPFFLCRPTAAAANAAPARDMRGEDPQPRSVRKQTPRRLLPSRSGRRNARPHNRPSRGYSLQPRTLPRFYASQNVTD